MWDAARLCFLADNSLIITPPASRYPASARSPPDIASQVKGCATPALAERPKTKRANVACVPRSRVCNSYLRRPYAAATRGEATMVSGSPPASTVSMIWAHVASSR